MTGAFFQYLKKRPLFCVSIIFHHFLIVYKTNEVIVYGYR